MLIEEAYALDQKRNESKLIGYRIQAGGATVLIWHDQKLMHGVRLIEKFVPNLNEVIIYKPAVVTDKNGLFWVGSLKRTKFSERSLSTRTA